MVGQEVLQALEVPLQPVVQTMEEHSGADIHLKCMEETTSEQVNVPEGPHGKPMLEQDLWPCGERSLHGSRVADRSCDLWDTHTGAACS
ncbi:hypothetical protein HGM15179_001491 [Zosterops borbonicus]|uniref:Uncharacterized protein n=1 Tax=Zosterops borbonicus TaxID=364589 RepID=A0A8K1GUK4_9PASS|nr:hypothetical protein HGM15179_001491 [Zosterops borbonicus]